MHKSWSRGKCWEIRTEALPENGGSRLLLTVHDAPRWIAEAMQRQAEKFVSPLMLRETLCYRSAHTAPTQPEKT